MKEIFDFAIIGGGAAGLFALRGLKEKKVCIIEGNSKLGLKLLATGGGKCNLRIFILRRIILCAQILIL